MYARPLKRLAFSMLATLALLAVAPTVRANPAIYEKTLGSTTWILGSKGMGSGVLVDRENRIVLTNYHVVRNDDDVTVYFPTQVGGETVGKPSHYVKNKQQLATAGRVLARDQKHDLAVVQVKDLPKDALAVPLAAKSARPGETVHAIGNSGVRQTDDGLLVGTLWRYSEGKVRQVYETSLKIGSPDGFSFTLEAWVLESQIPSNCGDSGGPVLNDKGELVALTQSMSLDLRLVSYSVDIREIRIFLADVRNGKKTNDDSGIARRVDDSKRTGQRADNLR